MGDKNLNENKNPNNLPKGNNIYWIYVAVFVFIILAALMLNSNDGAKEEFQSTFEEDAKKGFVEEIVVYKEKDLTEVDVFFE